LGQELAKTHSPFSSSPTKVDAKHVTSKSPGEASPASTKLSIAITQACFKILTQLKCYHTLFSMLFSVLTICWNKWFASVQTTVMQWQRGNLLPHQARLLLLNLYILELGIGYVARYFPPIEWVKDMTEHIQCYCRVYSAKVSISMPENCSRTLSRLADNLTRKYSGSIIENCEVTKRASIGVRGSFEEMGSFVVILFILVAFDS
jgi:hypothetical protein